MSGLEWHVWACECAVWNSVWCGQAQADFHLGKPWPLGNDHAPLVVAGDYLHLNYWFEKGFCFLESQSPGMVRLLEMSRSWKDLHQKTLRTPKAMGLTYERWTRGFGRILLHQVTSHHVPTHQHDVKNRQHYWSCSSAREQIRCGCAVRVFLKNGKLMALQGQLEWICT